MNTIILFWNPAISSYKMEYHKYMLSCSEQDPTFNWSIWEHDKAREGDRFFMVRCKNRPVPGQLNEYGKPLWEPCVDERTGICMAGYFTSNPYEGEDWSGKGRQTFYMDMDIEEATNPDECVILGTEELIEGIPSFGWKGGHSGRLLDPESAEKLERMYRDAVEMKRTKIWKPKR